MAWKTVTLRKKHFGNIFSAEATKAPVHGHGMEYFIDVLGILCSIAFVIGCYCFQSPSAEVYAIGDWCFIVASIVNVGICSHTLLEQIHHFQNKDHLKQTERDELKETLLFLVSAAVFAVGCVFFMPGLEIGLSSYTVAGLGTWFCITGSFMVVVAVFYNAMAFEDDKGDEHIDPTIAKLCVTLTRLGMFLLLFGGVFFVVGSFMYRPMFGGKCPAQSKDVMCLAVRSYGTKLYLAGSYCFLAQTIITLVIGIMKHNAQERAQDSLSETSKLIA